MKRCKFKLWFLVPKERMLFVFEDRISVSSHDSWWLGTGPKLLAIDMCVAAVFAE
jgi:hypothetical protein